MGKQRCYDTNEVQPKQKNMIKSTSIVLTTTQRRSINGSKRKLGQLMSYITTPPQMIITIPEKNGKPNRNIELNTITYFIRCFICHKFIALCG